MIECIETGLVYRNPDPHLRAVHAWHPSIVSLGDGELLVSYDLGQGAESLDSETVTVTPVDVFPPAVPQGLSASVEEGEVRLFWFPNKEEDLAGYHVYRAGDDGAFARITAEPFSSTIFADSTVEVDRRYHYRVTAVDGAGNESAPSESVERLVRAAPVF